MRQKFITYCDSSVITKCDDYKMQRLLHNATVQKLCVLWKRV